MLNIILIFLFLISAYYLIGIYHASYWRKRGVVYHKKNLLRLLWDYLTGNRSMSEVYGDVYFEHLDEPVVGTSLLLTPCLFIRDPKIIQYILSENFNAFYHRGIDFNYKEDKLANNVTFLNGPEWKLIRQKMSPLFTSAKLKNMQYIMNKSAQDFVDYLKNNLEKANENASETTSLFSCAAITASVFGIGTGSTFESPFIKFATEAQKPSWSLSLKFVLINVAPKLCNSLGMKFFNIMENMFISAFKSVLREREKVEVINSHDLPDLIVKIQKEGIMKDSSTGFEMVPTDDLMAAQGFFFLLAGVETSAAGMFFTLYELARHPDMLKRVQKEIDAAYRDNDGNITFEVISNMKYLDKCVAEALRMYPPIGWLTRKCTEDCVLPVGNIKVDKNTLITIPTLSIHRDPKIYPSPITFDPERDSSGLDKRPYLAFGDGNRICIGSRFAYLQMKTGLIGALRNFDVETKDPIDKIVRFLPGTFAIKPTNDTNFHFVPRKNYL